MILKFYHTIFFQNKNEKYFVNNVPNCTLVYIPERLHQRNRTPITSFEVGERLYFRCKSEVLDNPYKAISITELSHNRSGLNSNILCVPDDVLFNIKENEPEERYEGLEICIIEIKYLESNSVYNKTYSETKNSAQFNCRIRLIHEPDCCMYPHSVFRVWINDELITYDNYNDTVKKLNKIRSLLKNELASMIIQNALVG